MILIAECIVLCIIFTLIILPAQYKDPMVMIMSYPPNVIKRVEQLPQYAGCIKERQKKSSPESMSFLLAEMSDVHMVRKSATETIRGSVTEDSRKSLSPVRNRSACAFNAARRIGRSFGSRIHCSELTASSGVETSLMKDNALKRNA